MLSLTTTSPILTNAAACRAMWGAVVLETIDEAIEMNETQLSVHAALHAEAHRHLPVDQVPEVPPLAPTKLVGNRWIWEWANSPDGYEVLDMAGIEPSERVAGKLVRFVNAGDRTRGALSLVSKQKAA